MDRLALGTWAGHPGGREEMLPRLSGSAVQGRGPWLGCLISGHPKRPKERQAKPSYSRRPQPPWVNLLLVQ